MVLGGINGDPFGQPGATFPFRSVQDLDRFLKAAGSDKKAPTFRIVTHQTR
jgi:hypothetical protein